MDKSVKRYKEQHFIIERIAFTVFVLFLSIKCSSQEISRNLYDDIANKLTSLIRTEISTDSVKIESITASGNQIKIYTNSSCADFPFRPYNIDTFYNCVRNILPDKHKNKKILIYSNNREIEDYIPCIYSKSADVKHFTPSAGYAPLVINKSKPFRPTQGLWGRYIAMWQSHGLYFDYNENIWRWQRARLFQTVEDLYTQSYVLPYLVPMLENAGATVILPRERDCQIHEIIIDNDGCIDNSSQYTETNGLNRWHKGNMPGFAYKKAYYSSGENPFKDGTFCYTSTTTEKDGSSIIEWVPMIPENGEYAVYVSYHSLANSTTDAQYSIYHSGGITKISVNQTMGGGTWIYLGTFHFKKGTDEKQKIELSNISSDDKKLVTADAVKIGGGMGNISRSKNIYSKENNISRYPRFCEGARYWLQWAGFPTEIYHTSNGKNDYTDDLRSRAFWVNYISGKSKSNNTAKGLGLPIDLAFAFHSDAGVTKTDSIIGTLGIYNAITYNGKLTGNANRFWGHEMTDIIQTSIVNDIRSTFEPQWTRRGKWEKGYHEARIPKVPTMLLELLSHQNFADMCYGHDPNFRFIVSRAIYKGILKYLSLQYNTPYTVQPLPVHAMSIKRVEENKIRLEWTATSDTLETSAIPDGYIVYTRIGDRGFDNGKVVYDNVYETIIPTGKVCSFKVTAINKGGESFPSEILSAGISENSKGNVLIVNGFNRISGPDKFIAQVPSDTLYAGFMDNWDHGVPYIKDISYTGSMKEFQRNKPWISNDNPGFGDSFGNYETKVIAGNTFDYPALHGEAILNAGYSFVSCSNGAIVVSPDSQGVLLTDYKYVDYILGKQKSTIIVRGTSGTKFKTFNEKTQKAIKEYCQSGGNIFISGCYIASDLWIDNDCESKENDIEFAKNILKYQYCTSRATDDNEVKITDPQFSQAGKAITFNNKLNEKQYIVESPDGISPVKNESYTIMRYCENNISAAIAYKGNKYKTIIMAFPFESIIDKNQRENLMTDIMNFFNE